MYLDTQKILDVSSDALLLAGRNVLELARNNSIFSVKVDRQVVRYLDGQPHGSPYMTQLTKTNADIASHGTIVAALRRAFPEYPVLSEEEYIKHDATPQDTPYFILDPIDGTIHLEEKSPQWTINLALCVNGTPLLGVVVIPAEGRVFIGQKDQPSQWKEVSVGNKWETLKPSLKTRDELVVSKCDPLDLGRESEDPVTAAILAANHLNKTHLSGSAYRYIEVAKGVVDIIVHGAGNFLWDKAAAQVVVEGTGGALNNLPWHSLDPSGENVLADLKNGVPVQYRRELLKDEGHLVVSCNAKEHLNQLVIPKKLDRRSIWTQVGT